jgi:hypothetical protein
MRLWGGMVGRRVTLDHWERVEQMHEKSLVCL